MQRLKSRAQFQAVMAGSTVARTAHFALHRVSLAQANQFQASQASSQAGKPDNIPAGPESFRPQALFAVQDVAWMGAMVISGYNICKWKNCSEIVNANSPLKQSRYRHNSIPQKAPFMLVRKWKGWRNTIYALL